MTIDVPARFRVTALALCALLLGSNETSQLTDPATLVGQTGRRMHDFIFAPGGTTEILPLDGKPTVIVVFASWCPSCVAEMPAIVADAHAFGDRVQFVGIDYDDGSRGQRFIRKTSIEFPTESYDGDSTTATTPAHGLVVHVPNGRLTPDALDAFKDAVSARTYDALKQIAQAQRSGRSNLTQLEKRLEVYVQDIGSLPADGVDSLPLPQTFVIDGTGILRADLVGYDPGTDRLRAALAQLGVLDNFER